MCTYNGRVPENLGDIGKHVNNCVQFYDYYNKAMLAYCIISYV